MLSNVKTLEKSIGEKLIDLITQANVLTEIINGKPTLSIVTGLLVQDLISNCGCSMNKLPMIISTVITMFFGLVYFSTHTMLITFRDTHSANKFYGHKKKKIYEMIFFIFPIN